VTGVNERTERSPVRARSGRRPLPPLIFLLVLVLAALVVWWNVFGQQSDRDARKAAACTSAAQAPPSLDPATVNVRVLNATDQRGLAQTVASELQARGFVVDEVANDASGRKVTGAGEVRFGPRGADTARYVALYVPGASDYQDTRATAQVDLVIGPQYAGLAGAEQVTAGLAKGQSAQGAC
jgi:LytR cell envelope-related transcriptional attenuator